MKRNLWLLTLLISGFFLLTGCSKDNDDSPTIEGTWKIQKSVSTVYINGTVDNESGETINYNSGSTLTLKEGKITIVVDEPEDSYTDSGTYTYANDKLTIQYTEGEEDRDEFTIQKLTNTSLILVNEIIDTWEGNTYKEVTEIQLTR
ncbi:lipocalin family protein [Niabella ginsengisoli]|uniref:Lipocalin family protein n=1 Tax=Niabella ginsengisoli TaxID=522298 RepID=A0ABS9SEB6_9BACT|nr:lipocalin family protein [Niabella ginsengisoli]MCH5596696.1 lipocalin family protein [Niabella ginsengisoli]